MLPLHQNNRMELKRRLAYATEIADIYRMQIVAKKFRVGGKRGGSVRFPETRHFFCGLNQIYHIFINYSR